MSDTTEIRDLLTRLTDAWNAGDATAYAELFTQDADYITWLGTRDTGRAAIEATHRFLFDGPLKGSRLTGTADSTLDIRHLAPDAALVITDGGRAEQASVITLTAVRQEDGWRFASFQNTRKTARP
ncbi:SgcJ/EcaC family oxidoreductase [Actinosynnema sp. NPDC020468]|uniref:SgcJ/EcaC family oxidoreductase n=1 Tax=Actinosynnema sp. NPDC020468 TaxID=3154488 RepID=UPI0033E9E659